MQPFLVRIIAHLVG
jgi:hypothetical protein